MTIQVWRAVQSADPKLQAIAGAGGLVMMAGETDAALPPIGLLGVLPLVVGNELVAQIEVLEAEEIDVMAALLDAADLWRQGQRFETLLIPIDAGQAGFLRIEALRKVGWEPTTKRITVALKRKEPHHTGRGSVQETGAVGRKKKEQEDGSDRPSKPPVEAAAGESPDGNSPRPADAQDDPGAVVESGPSTAPQHPDRKSGRRAGKRGPVVEDSPRDDPPAGDEGGDLPSEADVEEL